jgi:hypothetical protein
MALKRTHDWPEQLHRLIRARWDTPFQWGVNDCGTFAADVVLAMTGVDIAADVRLTYYDEDHARDALRSAALRTLPSGSAPASLRPRTMHPQFNGRMFIPRGPQQAGVIPKYPTRIPRAARRPMPAPASGTVPSNPTPTPLAVPTIPPAVIPAAIAKKIARPTAAVLANPTPVTRPAASGEGNALRVIDRLLSGSVGPLPLDADVGDALAAYCRYVALKLGIPEVPVRFAQRGDLALHSSLAGTVLGVVSPCGHSQIIAPGEDGLRYLPLLECSKAWRIGS